MSRIEWAIALVAMVVGAPALAADYVVKPGKDTKVTFVSTATMETFDGKTNRMEGTIRLDPSAVGDTITAHLEVDLASLDTGIARRNQHMRTNHLETDRYPRAIFDGATVLGPVQAKLEPGKTVAFDLEGTFSLHGASRRLRTLVEATYTEQGGVGRIAFRAAFPVKLGDYGIARPQFLFLKLAEEQQVKVAAVAVQGR